MIKKEYEIMNLGQYVDISNLRIGQIGGYNCIIDSIKTKPKGSCTVLIIPTRYGKSDLIRLSAIELVEQGIVGRNYCVTPATFLKNQLCNEDKIKDMFKRHKISITKNKFVVGSIDAPFNKSKHFKNGESFVVLTTKMLADHADDIANEIKEYIIKNPDKRVLVHIDEAHTTSEENSWGEAALKMMSVGADIILYTATPQREDNLNLPGLNKIDNKVIESKKVVKRRKENNQIILDTHNAEEEITTLIGDYTYSFQRAFQENPPVLCKLYTDLIDISVKWEDNFECKINEIPSTGPHKKTLRDIVENKEVIKEAITRLLQHLKEFRKKYINFKIQAIIFCGNDLQDINEDIGENSNNNKKDIHAKKILKEIEKQDPTLKVVVATYNEDDSNSKIQKFTEGDGDILIVKQMASLGLDGPYIKVGLDLSSVRTRSAFIQRIMRIATVHNELTEGIFILPRDKKGEELSAFIKDNDGLITAKKTNLLELLNSKVLNENQDTDKLTSEVSLIEFKEGIDVTTGDNFDNKDYEYYNSIVSKIMPKHILKNISRSEIITIGQNIIIENKNINNTSNIQENNNIVINTSDERDKLRAKLKICKENFANDKHPNNYDKRQEFIIELSRTIPTKALGYFKRVEDQTNNEIQKNIEKIIELHNEFKKNKSSTQKLLFI